MAGSSKVLAGDVGGTHARFAVTDVSQRPFAVSDRAELDAGRFPSFEAALGAYLGRLGESGRPPAAAIAVAGPVTNGSVEFTNRGWQVSEAQLAKLGFSRALLINDFAALAFAVPALDASAFRAIGPELEGMPDEPVTILGAGTGFGVSCLARYRGRAIPVATEGGHMDFAPQDENEMAVFRILAAKFGHVSIERVVSGPGLENIYAALEKIAGRRPVERPAEDVTEAALKGDAGCRAALDMFCAVFGAAAGDFALAHGARGGVFIAGGIAAKIVDHLHRSGFRARFEAKGRMSDYVKAIPARLILEPDAAFIGAAMASVEFARE